MIGDLVDHRVDESRELDFSHRLEPRGGKAHGNADDARFREWSITYTVGAKASIKSVCLSETRRR
jgi:hypothetical protein